MKTGVALGIALRDRPCSLYGSDLKVGYANRRASMYPDLTVVCGEPRFGEAEGDTLLNPLIAMEVLSPSTERFDRTGKFVRYMNIVGLAAYLPIAQDMPRVELCARQDDGGWEWSEAEGLEATIAIPALDCALALADIYRRVRFAPG